MTARASATAGAGENSDQGLDAHAKETPLPWTKLSAVLGVRLCESTNQILILPFMYKMVSEFDIVKNPKDTAFFAALILTSLSFCQTLFIVHWGRLSDRIGRRPVLLMGLLGDTITMVLFGFSKNFWWALITRSLNGICVGNAPVAKSAIAEMADDTNRTRMMALLPLSWNLGAAIGALIGGTFSDPVDKFPQIFGSCALFKTYPYLLPCLISGGFTLICFSIGIFKFEETLDMSQRVTTSNTTSNQHSEVNESTHLLRGEEENTRRNARLQRDITIRALLSPTVVNVLLTCGLSNAYIMIAEHLYTIFAATQPRDGGLGFDTAKIGYTFLVAAVVAVYLQLVAYPRWDRKYGTLSCYRLGQKVMTIYFLLTPFLSPLANHIKKISEKPSPNSLMLANFPKVSTSLDWVLIDTVILWILLIILLGIQTVGIVFTCSSYNIIGANVAPSRAHLGLMNGVQQVVIGASRFIGPLVSGAVWAWSLKHDFYYPLNYHLTWIMSAGISISALLVSHKLPESVNRFGPDAIDNEEQENGQW